MVQEIVLEAMSEYEEVSYQTEKDILVMATLRAPLFEQDKQDERPAIDVCCVIDKSGSMAGAKLQLVKNALGFIIDNMASKDNLSVVVYDTEVHVDFDFSLMDANGKKMAKEKTEKIIDGSSTNLSGGLLKGIELVSKRKSPNDICSVLLFTDGLANAGLTNVSDITSAMENSINSVRSQNKTCSVFTFGFGTDHDENMLRKIAESGGGMYYFIADVDKIPVSFADCLGGLQSVVAQNLTLTLSPTSSNISILKSLNSKYKLHSKLNSNENAVLPTLEKVHLELGDIYSEEQRDLIFLIKVPKIENEQSDYQALKFELSYFNVLKTQDEEKAITLIIKRPVQESKENKPNVSLDIQRNRLLTAEAMEKGRKKADSGDLTSAKNEIELIKAQIQQSVSNNEAFTKKLVTELTECLGDMENVHHYKTEGAKKISRKEQAHYMQRSNKIDDSEQDFYETTSKFAYKVKSKK